MPWAPQIRRHMLRGQEASAAGRTSPHYGRRFATQKIHGLELLLESEEARGLPEVEELYEPESQASSLESISGEVESHWDCSRRDPRFSWPTDRAVGFSQPLRAAPDEWARSERRGEMPARQAPLSSPAVSVDQESISSPSFGFFSAGGSQS